MPDENNPPTLEQLGSVPLEPLDTAPDLGAMDEDVARLTRGDDDFEAETTDPSIFSIQADTRKAVNVWQLKVALPIAVPFAVLFKPAELFPDLAEIWPGLTTSSWQGPAVGTVLGLVIGLLVSGAVLTIRYRR
ncbi:MAG: hypothetical protein VX519_07990 [Myxococcota bacterium]|nr:hypothetical protein [Myxococcota bacterium]